MNLPTSFQKLDCTNSPNLILNVIILQVVDSFSGFDETKLREGKRDRCIQEIFLRDNKIALAKLPLDDYEQEWRKKHLHSAKKDARSRTDSVVINNYLREESSSLLFMERR